MRESSFDGPADFGERLAFGDFTAVVLLSAAAVADLADGDDVQGRVQGPVATGVEPVADVLAAGSIQRSTACVLAKWCSLESG
nr:hypothetical protein [Streptomyces virginiae]